MARSSRWTSSRDRSSRQHPRRSRTAASAAARRLATPLLRHRDRRLPATGCGTSQRTSGRPSFNALQNHGSSTTPILYYVFDVLIIDGPDVMAEPLKRRRDLLQTRVLSRLRDPIRESPVLEANLSDLVRSVKAQGLEGIVAKRVDSRYEPRQRSRMWQKTDPSCPSEQTRGRCPWTFSGDAVLLAWHAPTRQDPRRSFRGVGTLSAGLGRQLSAGRYGFLKDA
jgi:ATP dependent DNA ligase domain